MAPEAEREPLMAGDGAHQRWEGRRGGAGSRRAPLLVVAAIVAAGVIDGVARAHLGYPSWDEDDARMGRRLGLSDERPHLETLLALSGDRGSIGKLAAARVVVGGEDKAQSTEMLVQNFMGEACKEQWNCQDWLVCSGGVCSACESNYQCQERNPSRQCFTNISWAIEGELEYNVCKHKPLFFPFEWGDCILVVVTFLTIALAAPTGTGGGGILVPMYMIIGQFSAHSAVPLSKATILGGALANNFINIQRRHPFANRPVVDFDALQLLVPNLLAGTIFGVFFNAVSPDWLITAGLVITLGYSGFSAGKKAWALYAEEMRASEVTPLIGSGGASASQKRQLAAKHYSFDSKDKMPAELYEIVNAESKINFKALGVVTIAWALVFACSFIKGGSGSKRVVACGSLEFFLVALLPVPIIFVLSWRVGVDVCERFEQKRSLGFRFADGDPLWTHNNVRQYAFVALFVGVGAGALGIAAGTLLSPLLLSAGMNPLVCVASTGMMVLFTSSSTAVQYLILGRLQGDYAIFLMSVGVVAAVVGNTLVHFIVRKYRKTWFVVGILASTIILSTLLLGYTGFYRTLRSWLQDEDMGWRDLCMDRSHMLSEDPSSSHFPRHFPWVNVVDLF